MALEQITFNLGALEDSANSGKNYVSGQVFEVFNIDDTYADIFADSAGTIPIDQSGIQNISNSDGECKFFVDKGFYNIKSGGKTRQLNANFSFEFETVSDAVNARFISLLEGRRVYIEERETYFDVVLSSSFSGDGEGMDELTSISNSLYGFKLNYNIFNIAVESLGAPSYIDDSALFNRAFQLSSFVTAYGNVWYISGVDIPDGYTLEGSFKHETGLDDLDTGGSQLRPVGTSGYMLSHSSRSKISGFVFYDPNQKYSLTSNYINESFNQTADPIRIINPVADITLDNCAFIGFHYFVNQTDNANGNVSDYTVTNIRGFPLTTGFNIRRSLDVIRFDNVHCNLNLYRSYGKTSVDLNYYTKCALTSNIFKFGRVDDAQVSNCFAFGVKEMFEVVREAYTGDDSSGGGLTAVNIGVDMCSRILYLTRNDSSFGYKFANYWCSPQIISLDGLPQASFVCGNGSNTCEANEISAVSGSQFGVSGHPVIDPARTQQASNFVRFSANSQFNRFIQSSNQAIQLSGDVYSNGGVSTGSLRNTIHGEEVIAANPADKTIYDVDGNPLIKTISKSIRTYGIHNNTNQVSSEGLASATFNHSQGSTSNTNVSSVNFSSLCTYTKVGSVVTVSGSLTVTPSGSGTVNVYLAPPIAFSTGAGYGSGGVFNKDISVHIEKVGSDIRINFQASDTSSHFVNFMYSYTIV